MEQRTNLPSSQHPEFDFEILRREKTDQGNGIPWFRLGRFPFENSIDGERPDAWDKASIASTHGHISTAAPSIAPLVGGDDKPEPPPDGGLVAWTQVFVAHLLVVNGFGYVFSFGLFQAYYATTLNSPASNISWVGSVQIFLLFFIGTLSGRAMDAGYFRSLVYTGCTMQLVGVFATSFCRQYWQLFLSQGVLQGLGNGLLFTPLVSLVATYFSKNRTVALGFAACGAPTGGVIFPIVSLLRGLCYRTIQTSNLVIISRSPASSFLKSVSLGQCESWGL